MKPLQIASGERFAASLTRWCARPEFAAIEAHPLSGTFGRAYYAAVFGERRADASFAVVEGDRPVVIVPCSMDERELDYYGAPIRLFVATGLNEGDASRAVNAAFAHLDTLAGQGGIDHIRICDDASLGKLSLVGKQCLNRRATPVLRLTGLCTLERGEAGMREGLRKSFQSLINWGKRNLTIESVSAGNPNRERFDRYREFHATIAGRVTRSERSWDAMFDWIAAGHGELLLGFLAGGELVTGTMVVDGTKTAYYASGVYDRDRFDQPLGHWPLWLAMLNSAARGMRKFELGDLPLPDSASEKEFAIGYFKRGFATSIETSIAWTWTPAGNADQPQ